MWKWALYIVVMIVLVLLVFGAWKCSKTCTYNLSYKSMVKQTVIEMVKEEALKTPPSKK